MIAREKKPVLIEQDHVAARVAGHGDNDQLVIESHLFLTFDDALNPETGRAIRRVHDACGSKLFGEDGVVCYVVAMREKDCLDAAESLYLFDQRAAKARRIDKDVTAFGWRSLDEITPCAEACFRGEAAEEDILADLSREGINADSCVQLASCAD